jgi:hypothetical protein
MNGFYILVARSVFWLGACSPFLSLKIGLSSLWGAIFAVLAICGASRARRVSEALRNRAFGLFLTGAILVLAIGSVMSAPGLWLRIGCGFETALVLHQIALGFSVVSICVFVGQAFARWPLFRLAEAFGMVMLSSAVFAPHRHGMIHQPAWLADAFMDSGWNVLDGLRLAGIAAAAAGVFFLMASSLPPGKVEIWKRFTVTFAILLLAWFFSAQVGAPPLSVPKVERPPLSSDLPPPPPPPERVALVIFHDWFHQSQEIFFSSNKITSIMSDIKADVSDPAIRSEVHLLESGEKIPSLLRALDWAKLPARKPFIASYRVHSSPLAEDPVDALGMDELGSADWTPAQKMEFLETAPHSEMETLVESLAAEEPLVGGKIARIRRWLEQNVPLSEKAAEQAAGMSVQDLVVRKQPCGMEQLAGGLADMLRRAGVPARVADGFVYSPGTEFKKEVLLTSQHRRHWAEVHLKKGGWTPLSLHPENVMDRPDPPPQAELEDLLAQLNEKNDPERPADPARDFWSHTPTSIQAFLLALLGFFIFHPLGIVFFAQSAVLSLKHELCVFRLAGFRRNFGESWDEFAARVADCSPICSASLRATLAMLPASGPTVCQPLSIRPVLSALMIWMNLPYLMGTRIVKLASTRKSIMKHSTSNTIHEP